MTKKAFTVAEVLLVLGTTGILLAVTIPALLSAWPDPSPVLFKKAYYITDRIIKEMVHNDEYYPFNFTRRGLVNSDYNAMENGKKIDGAIGASKFCVLFSKTISAKGDVDCTTNMKALKNDDDGGGNFRTADGIVWSFPVEVFNDSSPQLTISIDVNGPKKPNCFYDSNDPTKCKDPDRFNIHVSGATGRLDATGEKEIEYLKASLKLKE